MSHLENLEDKIQHTFTSGQPGTTGREPFEEDRGESNPYHRDHQHKHEGTHAIGTGSDLIGRSSTGTGNERDINSGEGLRTHEQNPSRVGEGFGSGGLTGTHHQHGTTGGVSGALGRAENTAENAVHQHSTHGGAHTGRSEGLSGSSLTGNRHDNEHSSLTSTSGAGTYDNSSSNYPSTGSSLTSGGTAGGAGITAGTHGFQHHGQGQHGGVTGGVENAARREVDKHTSSGNVGDRTGNLGQDSALYERTGASGPATTGAAGTDRFDSDRVHGSSGLTSGSSGHHDATGEHGRENLSRTSGAGGILGTSDKDFIGRDRKAGSGAYADETGRFQGNTTGPGGSALTGREGTNPERDNPVARAESAGQNTGSTTAPGTHAGVTGHTNELEGKDGQEGSKGIFQKIKELI